MLGLGRGRWAVSQKRLLIQLPLPDQTCLSALDQNQNIAVTAQLHYDLQTKMQSSLTEGFTYVIFDEWVPKFVWNFRSSQQTWQFDYVVAK